MHIDLSEIKKIRKKLGLTQTDLSKLASVSQSLIAKIESNKVDPTVGSTNKIFAAFDTFSSSKKRLKDIMNKDIIFVQPCSSIKEISSLMKKKDIDQLPVIKQGVVLGLISQSSLIDCLLNQPDKKSVEFAMTEAPPIVPLNTEVDGVALLLKSNPLILVSEKGKIIGIITKYDLLNHLMRHKS